MSTTTNLADFGFRELDMLKDLIQAYKEQGLPEGFFNTGVHAMMNTSSGNVFLTNEDFQVAMINGNKLESFIHCPNCGHEDFASEFKLYDDGCSECQEDESEE